MQHAAKGLAEEQHPSQDSGYFRAKPVNTSRKKLINKVRCCMRWLNVMRNTILRPPEMWVCPSRMSISLRCITTALCRSMPPMVAIIISR